MIVFVSPNSQKWFHAIFLSCRNGTCIDFKYDGQFCIPNSAIRRNRHLFDKFQYTFIFPQKILVSLFIVEITFTFLKSAFLQHHSIYSPSIVVLSFIIESLSGIALTTIQVVSICLDISFNHDHTEFDVGNKNGFIWGSALSIVSEVITVISEMRYIYKRLAKLRVIFTPLRGDCRIIGDMTVLSSLLLLIFSLTRLERIEPIDSHTSGHLLLSRLVFVGFILIYAVMLFAVIWKEIKRACLINLSIKWRTIILLRLGTLFFTVISILAIVSQGLFPHHCSDIPIRFNVNDLHKGVVAVIFMLSVHMMAISIYTFGMEGLSKFPVSQAQQFQILLIAFVGISGPGIVFTTSTMCLKDILNIVMVAYPQLLVIVCPILVELIVPKLQTLFSKYLKPKGKDFEQSTTTETTASTERNTF